MENYTEISLKCNNSSVAKRSVIAKREESKTTTGMYTAEEMIQERVTKHDL